MIRPLSLKRKILYLTVPYILIFGFLLLAEGAVRTKYDTISKLALMTGGNFERKVELVPGRGRQVFEGDAMLGWKLMNELENAHWDFTTFSTNNQGIRYPKNIVRKRKGTIRIISLGDSVTFGYRVPLAFPDDPLKYDRLQMTFTQLIELSLRKNNPEKEIEVIPMAVPGYTTHQGLLWLRRDIESLDPDLVIVLFGWNDTEMHRKSDLEALPDDWLKQTEIDILSKSQALIYLNKWLKNAGTNEQNPNSAQKLVPRVSQQEYINNILAIRDLAEKNNAKVLVIGTVLRDIVTETEQSNKIADYRRELARIAAEKNINYLEIPELTEAGHPGNEILFGELIHPNFLGHKLMAEKILNLIEEKNLLSE